MNTKGPKRFRKRGRFFHVLHPLDMIISTATPTNATSVATRSEEELVEALQHELIVAMQAVEDLNERLDKHCSHAIVDHYGRLLHVGASVSECVDAGTLHNYAGKIVRHRWNHNQRLVEPGNWLDANGLHYYG